MFDTKILLCLSLGQTLLSASQSKNLTPVLEVNLMEFQLEHIILVRGCELLDNWVRFGCCLITGFNRLALHAYQTA